MPICTVGLNYRTAPVELREALAIHKAEWPAVLQGLHTTSVLAEVAILSTCNRLEIYAASHREAQAQQTMTRFLQKRTGDRNVDVQTHCYCYTDRQAIEHLMQVACGLDSQILGEPQILRQIGQGWTAAQSAGTVGPILQRLFAAAVHAGKRARSETAISRHTTSASHAAVWLAEAHMRDLRQAHVLLAGAGEMAQLALKALQNRQVRHIGCINRTYTKAAALVQPVNGEAFSWPQWQKALLWADVVIAVTGTPHTVVHADEVAAILPQRAGRELVFVDLALPRDIEEDVEHLAGIHRYDIDDLRASLDANLARREAARPGVQRIIDAELETFWSWHNSRQVVPALVSLRRQAQAIAQAELDAALAQLPDLAGRDKEVVQGMVHRLVNKLLHMPTVQLKAVAAESPALGQEYAQALRTLFDLPEHDLSSLDTIATTRDG